MVNICTICRNDKKLLNLARVFHICVSYNSKRKWRTFPYTTLTDWFCRCKNGVFSVRNGQFVVKKSLLGYEAESIGEQFKVLREIAAFTLWVRTKTALKMEARFLACTARSLYQLPYPRLVKEKKSSVTRKFAKEQKRRDEQLPPL